MTFSRRVAFLMALALLVAAALVGAADRSAAKTAKTPRLAAFGSCGQLLDYAKSNASRFVGPYGFGSSVARGGIPMPQPGVPQPGVPQPGVPQPGVPQPGVPQPGVPSAAAAPVQGVDYSGTNVQEEGVDEPDMVKTNGNTLFAIANGKLNAVDVSDAKPRLLDSLRLETGAGELLLYRDRLLVLSNGGYWIQPLPAMARSIAPWHPAKSVLAEIDVSDPAKLRLVRTLTLDGSYVAARLVGGSVRIVAAAQVPSELPFVQPASQSQEALAAAKSRNHAVVASSRATSWLPSYRIKRAGAEPGKERPLVQCRHVSRPPAFSGFGMLTVLTLDLAKGLEPIHSTSIMTDGRMVYASPESLYVATERWSDRPLPEKPTKEVDGVTTAIHKFDISSPLRTQYKGSGSVSGYLLSQWSLSEYRGVLRVVSTESPAWWGPGGGEPESFLTTLRSSGGALVQAGRIGGLGKNEHVYAVRFVGDTGYVVTFRQIDPLYTVDLSIPERPRVLGELKIPGYSAYLHPVGEDLLLGVGQDATEDGRSTGTQISLFDVSDLRKPARLYKESLGFGWSEAESDHHAFLYWPRTGLVVVPFQQRAMGFRVGRARGIDRAGRIDHEAGRLGWTPGVRRSLVVRDSVLTVSDAGVKSSSLATLAARGWAAFAPAEAPKPLP